MEYKKIIVKIEESEEFKAHKKNSPEIYLVHIFAMLDAANKGIYQVGYLNPKTDKVITFIVDEKITVNPESEVLKEPETTIFPLDLDKVSLDEDSMVSKITEFKEKTYPKLNVLKSFYILQHIDIGQVFNFTYLTADFKTLNLKMEANSGEILRHSLKDLMSFDK